jgi:hypothetical protein
MKEYIIKLLLTIKFVELKEETLTSIDRKELKDVFAVQR